MGNSQSSAAYLFGVTTGITLCAAGQYLLDVLSLSVRGRRFVQRLEAGYGRVTPGSTSVSEGTGAEARSPSFPSPSAESRLAELESKFNIPAHKCKEIVKHFIKEMNRGLAAPGQTLKMIPSYVTLLPEGSETGSFLALDLGGSNFRVILVELDGLGHLRQQAKKFVVSKELKEGNGEALFDFFADCIANFMVDNKMNVEASYPLGFTFSFPVKQTKLNAGTLMHWTKGFVCPNVEGEDVVALLQQSLKRKNLKISVTALVNDTVGTLVAHAYHNPSTYVGVILGTGSNAAYVERIDHIGKWDGQTQSKNMIINCEWGAFDQEGVVLPSTEYDILLDRQSAHPRLQTYEKMISGMYLGELTRICLVDLIKQGILFRGCVPKDMEVPYSFDTAFMSRIERDHSIELSDTKVIFEELFGAPKTSLADRQAIRRVVQIIGTRAARLAAIGVAAIVTKINKLDGCTVAVDGSLFEHYPHFGNRMRDVLRELLGMTAENIMLEQARDGSGQGAALIACLAEKEV